MTNAVYIGHVRHRRFAERRREFQHRIAFVYRELGDGDARAIRERTASASGVHPDGPVRVLGHPRGFNPVRLYYCFDRDERLQSVLAEVTNTPWGERQSYVVARDSQIGTVLRGESAKVMHVSPFLGMDQRYDWRVAEPGTTLSVHIENREHGERVFDATLSLKRHESTRRTLMAAGASGLRTLALIYGHAAAIRASGIRTRPHPLATGR